MKNLILVTALFVASAISANTDGRNSQHWKKFREDIKFCKEKFEIPMGKEHLKDPVPEDKICYYHCFAERRSLMNEDGEITIDNFKRLHPRTPQQFIDNYMECVEANEDTDEKCEKAKEIHVCLKKKFEEEMQIFQRAKKECMEEFAIPVSHMRKPIPDDKICFYKCFAVKMDSMNEDGKFTIEDFKSKHPNAPVDLIKHMEECAETSGMDDDCASAKAFDECIKSKSHW